MTGAKKVAITKNQFFHARQLRKGIFEIHSQRNCNFISLLLASFPLLGHDFRIQRRKSECLYCSTRVSSTKAYYQHGNTLFRAYERGKIHSVLVKGLSAKYSSTIVQAL